MPKKTGKKKTSRRAPKAPRVSERALGQAFGAALAKSGAERSLGAMFGAAMAKGMKRTSGHMKSPKRKLSKAEKAARARVRNASGAMARAARLPGGKRSKVGKSKTSKRKTSKSRTVSAPKPAARRSKGPKMVTAQSVVAKAASKALQKWVCEGARRSGCGAGGSRVVTAKGSFYRIRPPRFMTGG